MLQCDTVHAFICCTNRHLLVGHSTRSSLSSYLGSLSFNTEYGSTTSAALSAVIILSSLFHSRLSAAALCCLCSTRLSERRNVPSLIQHLLAKYDIPAAVFNITQKPQKYYGCTKEFTLHFSEKYAFQGNSVIHRSERRLCMQEMREQCLSCAERDTTNLCSAAVEFIRYRNKVMPPTCNKQKQQTSSSAYKRGMINLT